MLQCCVLRLWGALWNQHLRSGTQGSAGWSLFSMLEASRAGPCQDLCTVQHAALMRSGVLTLCKRARSSMHAFC